MFKSCGGEPPLNSLKILLESPYSALQPTIAAGHFICKEGDPVNYMDEIRKKEKEQDKKIEAEKKVHKCYNCTWGHWDDRLHYCMFSRCIRERKQVKG